MSYIDRNLLADERVIFRTRKHLIIFLTPVILSILALYPFFSDNFFLREIARLIWIVALILWGHTFLIYYTSEFAVTNKRVMMKEGFFYRHANEMRLATIARVDIDQSLLGQLFNYGNIAINSFGTSVDNFSQIASPNAFQKAVQEAQQT